MRFLILVTLLCPIFFACETKKNKHQISALSQIKDFDVFPFFSPYEKMDHNFLFKILIDRLNDIGRVEIIEEELSSKNVEPFNGFFLSISGNEDGFIKITSLAQVLANDYKIECPIWNINFTQIDDRLPTPYIDEEGKINFRKALIEKKDSESVLNTMIAYFAEEYTRVNPKEEKPTFYLHMQPVLQSQI